MSGKKGFTLIELLAIIVILAIIAVITVPIILNVIDNSKKGVAIDSAYGYRDAIKKFYMSKMLADNNYIIENGEYDISFYTNDGLYVSGEHPSAGWVMVKDRNITDFSFKIGEYAVTYDSSTDTITALKDGEVVLSPTQRKVYAYLNDLKAVKGNASDLYSLPVEGVSSADVTSGWVALNNGEVVGYSLQVGDNVLFLSTKDESVESIVETLASSYIINLSTQNSAAIIDITESGKLKGGFIEYVSDDSVISINDYSLKYEIDGIVKYANYVDNKLVIENIKHVTPIPGMIVSGVKYYDTEWIKMNPVQYSPGHVATATAEAIEPGKCTSGEDCKTWYPYSEFTKNGQVYVNMLMDRNISTGLTWCSQADYMGTGDNPVSPSQNSIQNSVGISYPDGTENFPAYTNKSYKNVKGPLTVLKQLHDSTDSWNLELATDLYTQPSNTYANFTIDYSEYKARLLSIEEVAFIIRKNTAENPNSWNLKGEVYFGTLNDSFSSEDAAQLEQQKKYSWLFNYTKNCLIYGCSIEDSTVSGYWTNTSCVGGNSGAYLIDNYGRVVCLYVNNTSKGVRPVITVLKSEIF